MQKLIRDDHTPYFVPDYIANSIADIDFKVLKSSGIKYLAFDADSTLVEYRGKIIADETVAYLLENKKLFDGLCIATNRVVKDLEPMAKSIGADLIQATGWVRKPKQKFFQRIMDHYDAQPHEIAMIGDKLVADMHGAKRAGLVTVWVERMGVGDSIWDRFLGVRRFEKRMMRKYMKVVDVSQD